MEQARRHQNENTMDLDPSRDPPKTPASTTAESQRIPCAQPQGGSTRDEDVVPGVIERLMNDGISFDRVDPKIWKISGWSAELSKSLSTSFTLEIPCTSEDIIDGFSEAHFDVSTISSIQHRNSSNSWVVSFMTRAARELALKTKVAVLGNDISFGSANVAKNVMVKIFEAPHEMPDTVIIGRLSHYGKVLSFKRERNGHYHNGIRSARMKLCGPVPATIFIAGEMIKIWHPEQPKTCRRCGSPDHLAQTCKSARCWNCEESGHCATECKRKPLCGICLREDHPLAECPYLVCSANMADVRAGVTMCGRGAHEIDPTTGSSTTTIARGTKYAETGNGKARPASEATGRGKTRIRRTTSLEGIGE